MICPQDNDVTQEDQTEGKKDKKKGGRRRRARIRITTKQKASNPMSRWWVKDDTTDTKEGAETEGSRGGGRNKKKRETKLETKKYIYIFAATIFAFDLSTLTFPSAVPRRCRVPGTVLQAPAALDVRRHAKPVHQQHTCMPGMILHVPGHSAQPAGRH